MYDMTTSFHFCSLKRLRHQFPDDLMPCLISSQPCPSFCLPAFAKKKGQHIGKPFWDAHSYFSRLPVFQLLSFTPLLFFRRNLYVLFFSLKCIQDVFNYEIVLKFRNILMSCISLAVVCIILKAPRTSRNSFPGKSNRTFFYIYFIIPNGQEQNW